MAISSRLKAGSALAMSIAIVIGGFEGMSNYAYRDPVGIPTICFGETHNVHMGDHATTAQCQALLGSRVVEFSRGVDKCLTNESAIPDKMYAAEVSLAYNIGVGAFCGSTLVKKTNAGDLRGACDEFPKWNKARGIVLPGLTARRAQERALCLEGITHRRAPPVVQL